MTRHIGAFWGLLADCIPQDRIAKMAALLEDETEFKTPHRIPTLTQKHPEFVADGRYWRGGVWASTNYMVLQGLHRNGFDRLAHEIAVEHLQAVVDLYKQDGTLYECYAPKSLAPSTTAKGNPVRRDFVGWTGLSPIAVLFESVFGIRADVPSGIITWDIRLTEGHGAENLPFGKDGKVSLRCESRNSENDRPVIHCTANIPVKIRVLWGQDQSFEVAI